MTLLGLCLCLSNSFLIFSFLCLLTLFPSSGVCVCVLSPPCVLRLLPLLSLNLLLLLCFWSLLLGTLFVFLLYVFCSFLLLLLVFFIGKSLSGQIHIFFLVFLTIFVLLCRWFLHLLTFLPFFLCGKFFLL